nr:immunoglobulin light chain junction region [Macaca mulatta]MOX47694.1 immunoglobulin light chain junction region [Macaca mulatta]MOX47704.1 immunoglobulin light chain junction region [Macaca mulatta]MOX47728.1 immunoglobulin light chain junction region [Macaca mulatta]MOX47758.1 immunoglobulin light chain junction region [Macaca mulatta]
CQQGYSHPYTF